MAKQTSRKGLKKRPAGKGRQSPAMQQFFRAKQAYPDALMFFRLGDFYEMFFEDAVVAAQLLDITLTSRGNDEHGVAIPMAGVPHHAATGYIARLIALGRSVAVCEQMADPSSVKGIVPREVVRVVTPSQVVEEEALDARNPAYLAAVAEYEGGFGLAVLELSTAELRATTLEGPGELLAELARLAPRELLLPHDASSVLEEIAGQLKGVQDVCAVRSEQITESKALENDQGVQELIADATAADPPLSQAAVQACRIALGYAQACQPKARIPVQRVAPYDPSTNLMLDEAAVRNLELVKTLGGDRKGALLQHLDCTETAVGARLLRHRILAPLCDVGAIRRRHDVVERLVDDSPIRSELRGCLGRIGDIERLSTRAALGVATPRDLRAIGDSLSATQEAFARIAAGAPGLTDDVLRRQVPSDMCDDVCVRLLSQLCEQPPVLATQGRIFVADVDPRIAELRELSDSGKEVLLRMEAEERARTGISTLKIKFTKVFGYYIEVSKLRLDAVPDEYKRKQTVASGERYTTEALEALQAKILNADERLKSLEFDLFERLRAEVGNVSPRLRRLAQAVADLDVHCAFAEGAHRYGYARPSIDESTVLEFSQSRHAIVERMVQHGDFVPNDIMLDCDAQRMMIITGPNMAGKSTTMRQVALGVIMAQAGSFVPAKTANIGLVDRIYTRVGASDNVAQGQSTFMVEMREAASIMRGATRRSLVVLDEIGRGTSTYDGLSIAWAVAEHLHDVIGCRSMFATHYHELCELAASRQGVVNFNVAAREYKQDVVFLRKLVPGGANRSYGIAVAKLAGLPQIVVARARAMLEMLETGQGPGSAAARDQGPQLDMFAPPAPSPNAHVLSTLSALEVDRMTPVEALLALSRLQTMLVDESGEQ